MALAVTYNTTTVCGTGALPLCTDDSCGESFRSLHLYYLIGGTCSFCGSLFVMLTYLFSPSLRTHPSVIIFGRSIFDFGYSLSFISLYFIGSTSSGLYSLVCGSMCNIMGPLNVFMFLCSEGYFLSILIDLYLSISNPFLNSASYTKAIRITIIMTSTISVIIIHTFWHFDYNRDLEYCAIGPTEQVEDWNLFHWVFIFGPTMICMISPFFVTIYAFNRLTKGLPNTFFIRIKALKDTLVYCAAFTMYFFAIGFTYFITWNKSIDEEHDERWFQIHALSSSLLGVIDFIVWTSRKCNKMVMTNNHHHMDSVANDDDDELLDNKYDNKLSEMNVHPISPDIVYLSTTNSDDLENDYEAYNNHLLNNKNKKKKNNIQKQKQKRKRKRKNCCKRLFSQFGVKQESNSALINKALRREVVAYTTDGIAQSVLGIDAHSLSCFSEIEPAYYPRQMTYNRMMDMDGYIRMRQFKISIKHNITLLQSQPDSLDRSEAVSVSGRFCFCFNLRMNKESGSYSSMRDRERLFTDYAPLIFQYVRNNIIGISDEDYISSIIPSNAEDQLKVLDVKYGEGKSGAFFYFSWDSKFIVKTVSSSEVQYLLSFLEEYVHHLEHNRNTILSRIVGIHSCKFYNIVKHFVVMENVFLGDLKPNEVYDLKGSWMGRSNTQKGGKVHKDLDLKRYIILNKATRSKIVTQLENDTQFLCENQIMDYSLLLGIYYMKIAFKSSSASDEQHNCNDIHSDYLENNGGDIYGGVRASLIEGPGIYYFGIIDAIQKYTLKKQLETWFKRYILRKDKDGISCVDPQLYKKRFMKYMRSIMISNDKWHAQSNIGMDRFGDETVEIYPSRNVYFHSMKNVRQKRIASLYSYASNLNQKPSFNLSTKSINYSRELQQLQQLRPGDNTFTSTPVLMDNTIHEEDEEDNTFVINLNCIKCDGCYQTVHKQNGKNDVNDGNWYCFACWDTFYG